MKGTIKKIHRIHDGKPDYLIMVDGMDERQYALSFFEGQALEFEAQHDEDATRITLISDLEQDVTPYSGVPL